MESHYTAWFYLLGHGSFGSHTGANKSVGAISSEVLGEITWVYF